MRKTSEVLTRGFLKSAQETSQEWRTALPKTTWQTPKGNLALQEARASATYIPGDADQAQSFAGETTPTGFAETRATLLNMDKILPGNAAGRPLFNRAHYADGQYRQPPAVTRNDLQAAGIENREGEDPAVVHGSYAYPEGETPPKWAGRHMRFPGANLDYSTAMHEGVHFYEPRSRNVQPSERLSNPLLEVPAMVAENAVALRGGWEPFHENAARLENGVVHVGGKPAARPWAYDHILKHGPQYTGQVQPDLKETDRWIEALRSPDTELGRRYQDYMRAQADDMLNERP